MNNISDEEVRRFLTKFPGYSNSYSEDDLYVLVNYFVKGGGRFELQDFIGEMNQVYQNNQSVRQNPNAQGIHMQAQVNRPGPGHDSLQSTFNFQNFSEDGTSAVSKAA